MVLVVASVNTVSDSKCPDMVMIERLREAASGTARANSDAKTNSMLDSNAEPKRAVRAQRGAHLVSIEHQLEPRTIPSRLGGALFPILVPVVVD
jgi:hypothetical protein